MHNKIPDSFSKRPLKSVGSYSQLYFCIEIGLVYSWLLETEWSNGAIALLHHSVSSSQSICNGKTTNRSMSRNNSRELQHLPPTHIWKSASDAIQVFVLSIFT